MATSFDVNLSINSFVGYRRSSTHTFTVLGQEQIGGVDGPRPLMTTTLTLEGLVQPSITLTGTKVVTLSTTTAFYTNPGIASLPQTITITNYGSDTLNLVEPYFIFSGYGVIANINNISSLSVDPNGGEATFDLRYIGVEPGEFYNYVIMLTDADESQYKIITRQIISNSESILIDPLSYSLTSTDVGFESTVTYAVTEYFNGLPTDAIVPLNPSLSTTATGWSLISSEDNNIVLKFNANVVNNVTGTYISTLTVIYNDAIINLENTADITPDYSDYYNISSWMSAPSTYNSIVGLSYDVINGFRYLTIGIGSGTDGSLLYGLGGSAYLSINDLNHLGAASITPYKYWAKVYRIPLDGTARSYYSKDYVVKDELEDYAFYYGENLAPGSIFIVEDDGYYNLTIKINHLRELPEDTTTQATVKNISNAFYEYSDVDILGGRYYQLSPVLGDGASTYLFVGFNNDGSIRKYPVPLPQS